MGEREGWVVGLGGGGGGPYDGRGKRNARFGPNAWDGQPTPDAAVVRCCQLAPRSREGNDATQAVHATAASAVCWPPGGWGRHPTKPTGSAAPASRSRCGALGQKCTATCGTRLGHRAHRAQPCQSELAAAAAQAGWPAPPWHLSIGADSSPGLCCKRRAGHVALCRLPFLRGWAGREGHADACLLGVYPRSRLQPTPGAAGPFPPFLPPQNKSSPLAPQPHRMRSTSRSGCGSGFTTQGSTTSRRMYLRQAWQAEAETMRPG